ncbi:metallophosphoesterase [Bacillus sonorensis]|uniref:Metallo-dependent phosphatase YkoQ n=2 Tax=Bacillus sonorensis TaxID=119858 RepID=M5PBL2_9BACI|nr:MULTISPECIES: metallophosphoesterase [Bacillus]TWK85453.1 3',5'-cyclic adenosine monophosphate phosphodiesterase CpdA [Bacillus paralicheniformis]ASB90521.1 putative metallophosphoesterase YkoQ [Bacillus sonorensis]EME72117.1 metallo-dependent phosphatase YkoQ [Bacillus sonorensis L12]MCZ0075694.1 metallophosphoesterase [Bacillus sonorensis]MCZ0094316.1 metallophosphoesterase [Bacillus sonorensis]
MFFATVLLLLMIGLIPIVYKANRNTKDVKVNTISVKRANGSAFKKKLNILHLSDLHLENISISPKQILDMARKTQVDLIALTGDFLDRKRNIPKLANYLKALQELKPAYGMYAVFGNHDYVLKGRHFDKLKSVLEENGCVTLRNEHVSVQVDGGTLNIIGIDDYSTNRSNIRDAYKGVNDGYHLVLTHDPNVVLEMKEFHFDYLLSGHFHGGQIHWPKPYHLIKMGKLVRMNMIKGLNYLHDKPFYISEGLGQTGANIRIGSRPEVTFHHIS